MNYWGVMATRRVAPALPASVSSDRARCLPLRADSDTAPAPQAEAASFPGASRRPGKLEARRPQEHDAGGDGSRERSTVTGPVKTEDINASGRVISAIIGSLAWLAIKQSPIRLLYLN